MTRNHILHLVMTAWIITWLAIGYGSLLSSAQTVSAAGPVATPSGSIGHPVSTHKPPREPRLTMPPTDTEG